MQRRREARARRSAAEWFIRGVLALLVAALGYVGVAHSFAYVIKSGSPARAHALAPWDGRITARLARKLLTVEATPAQRGRSEQLARVAFEQDATAVPAVTTLGLNAQIRGQIQTARRLFAYAQKLSRRDLETQLWAVEDAISRDDIPGALGHYDTALRTSYNAPTLMYPILTSAASDPAIRVSLVKVLAGNPPWATTFTDYAAIKGTDPRSIADLFQRLRQKGGSVSEEAQAAVINGLVAGGAVEDAWRYYASVRPGADRRASRNPRFSDNIANPSPFDWIPINDAGIDTSIQHGSDGGVFDFSARASVGGILLQQTQMLPPGDYRIEGHSTDIDQPERSLPYWVLSCRDGHELGRVVMPNSSQANGVFSGRFSVPAGCPVQTLALVAQPSDAVSGVAGQIDRVQLVPVR